MCAGRKCQNHVVFWVFVQHLTSLSRLALTWSGLSDMTKSLVVSTEGATPSPSGAYWTFLSISFTMLLDRANNQIKNWNLKRLIFFHSATVLRLFKGKCSWRWTPQASRWDSPFAYFSVLALSAERLDLKLHGTLLQKKKREEVSPSCDCSLHHFDSSVRFLPCRHHGPLAEGPLSKAGCQGTVTTNQHCSQWISLYYRLLYWVILSFT